MRGGVKSFGFARMGICIRSPYRCSRHAHAHSAGELPGEVLRTTACPSCEGVFTLSFSFLFLFVGLQLSRDAPS